MKTAWMYVLLLELVAGVVFAQDNEDSVPRRQFNLGNYRTVELWCKNNQQNDPFFSNFYRSEVRLAQGRPNWARVYADLAEYETIGKKSTRSKLVRLDMLRGDIAFFEAMKAIEEGKDSVQGAKMLNEALTFYKGAMNRFEEVNSFERTEKTVSKIQFEHPPIDSIYFYLISLNLARVNYWQNNFKDADHYFKRVDDFLTKRNNIGDLDLQRLVALNHLYKGERYFKQSETAKALDEINAASVNALFDTLTLAHVKVKAMYLKVKVFQNDGTEEDWVNLLSAVDGLIGVYKVENRFPLPWEYTHALFEAPYVFFKKAQQYSDQDSVLDGCKDLMSKMELKIKLIRGEYYQDEDIEAATRVGLKKIGIERAKNNLWIWLFLLALILGSAFITYFMLKKKIDEKTKDDLTRVIEKISYERKLKETELSKLQLDHKLLKSEFHHQIKNHLLAIVSGIDMDNSEPEVAADPVAVQAIQKTRFRTLKILALHSLLAEEGSNGKGGIFGVDFQKYLEQFWDRLREALSLDPEKSTADIQVRTMWENVPVSSAKDIGSLLMELAYILFLNAKESNTMPKDLMRAEIFLKKDIIDFMLYGPSSDPDRLKTDFENFKTNETSATYNWSIADLIATHKLNTMLEIKSEQQFVRIKFSVSKNKIYLHES